MLGGCRIRTDDEATEIRRQAVADPKLFPGVTERRFRVAKGDRINEDACQKPCPRVELLPENGAAILLYRMLEAEDSRLLAPPFLAGLQTTPRTRQATLLRAFRALRDPRIADLRQAALKARAAADSKAEG